MQVMARDASGDRAQNRVMAGVMAGDAPRDRAGQAADRLSAVDGNQQSSGASRGKQNTHERIPLVDDNSVG